MPWVKPSFEELDMDAEARSYQSWAGEPDDAPVARPPPPEACATAPRAEEPAED